MDHRRHPGDTPPAEPPDGPDRLSAAVAEAGSVLGEAEACLAAFSRGFRSYLAFLLEMRVATIQSEALTRGGFEGMPTPFGGSAAIHTKIRGVVLRGLEGGFLRSDDPLVAPLITPAAAGPNAGL